MLVPPSCQRHDLVVALDEGSNLWFVGQRDQAYIAALAHARTARADETSVVDRAVDCPLKLVQLAPRYCAPVLAGDEKEALHVPRPFSGGTQSPWPRVSDRVADRRSRAGVFGLRLAPVV